MYPAVEILLPFIFKVFKTSSGKSELVFELGFRYMLVAITCKYILGLFVGPINSFYDNEWTEGFLDRKDPLLLLRASLGLSLRLPFSELLRRRLWWSSLETWVFSLIDPLSWFCVFLLIDPASGVSMFLLNPLSGVFVPFISLPFSEIMEESWRLLRSFSSLVLIIVSAS